MNKRWMMFIYFFAFALSQSGDWLFMFVIPWIIINETKSAVESANLISVLGLMNGILALLGSVLAPVAMNRSPKIILLLILNIGLGVFSLLVALSYSLSFPLLLVLSFVTLKSAFFGMCWPVDGAFFADTFPDNNQRESLYRHRSRLMHVTRILVFIFGGYMIVSIGPSWLLAWDSLSFFLVALVFYFLTFENIKRGPAPERKNLLKLWSRGFSFLSQNKSWASLLIIFSLLIFLGTINFSLTPVFSSKEKNWDSSSLGWILAAGGIGGIVGNYTPYSKWVIKRGLMFSIFMFCMTSFLLPFSTNVISAFIVYFLIVFANSPMFLRIGNQLQSVNMEIRESLLAIQSVIINTIAPILRFPLVFIMSDLGGLSVSSTMSVSAVIVFLLILPLYYFNKEEIEGLYAS